VISDAAERAQKRENLQRDPAWVTYLSKSADAAYLISQDTRLMVPTPFFNPES